jgi:hypothetical protein
MILVRIEPVKDEQSQMFYVAIFSPPDAEQPLVTTRPRYKSAALAESDIVAAIAATANRFD